MILITAFVVASLERNGDGCLGSIDITGDWIGTMRSKLSFAYLHQICKDLSSVATGKWRIELADNRRVGSLTRKVQFRNVQNGNHVAVEATFYDKLLETLM